MSKHYCHFCSGKYRGNTCTRCDGPSSSGALKHPATFAAALEAFPRTGPVVVPSVEAVGFRHRSSLNVRDHQWKVKALIDPDETCATTEWGELFPYTLGRGMRWPSLSMFIRKAPWFISWFAFGDGRMVLYFEPADRRETNRAAVEDTPRVLPETVDDERLEELFGGEGGGSDE